MVNLPPEVWAAIAAAVGIWYAGDTVWHQILALYHNLPTVGHAIVHSLGKIVGK